jgi:hypothetical protein
LAKEVCGQEAAAEALQQTIEKGDSYEDRVVEEIRAWAVGLGLQVRHVGKDNQPGDVLIAPVVSSTVSCSLTIVVEARDRQSPVGRKAISDILAKAMSERSANAGIYVSKQSDRLGKEIGDWAEGAMNRGPFVARTHNNLFTALRFLMGRSEGSSLRRKVFNRAIRPQPPRHHAAIKRSVAWASCVRAFLAPHRFPKP